MKFSITGSFLLFAILFSGFSTVSAQTQLQRISTTERADGQGLVVRYHLTQLPDSFRVSQPSLDRVEMVLFSMDLNTSQAISVSITPQLSEVEFYNLRSGVGTDIYPAEGVYFIADAYPDVNGRDVLLSLRYADREEVLALTETTDRYEEEQRGETGVVQVEDEELAEPDGEIQQRPADISRRNWGVAFGVRAGFSASNVNQADISAGWRRGMMLAFTADIDLPVLLPYHVKPGIETGFYYSERGFQNPTPQFWDGVTYEFDYIELPVLAKLSVEITDFLTPYIVLGPSVNFMVSAERVRQNGSRRDMDSQTREVDFSGVFGVGADLKLGNIVLNAQLRNSLSLNNAFVDEPEGIDPVQFRHNYTSLVFGVRF